MRQGDQLLEREGNKKFHLQASELLNSADLKEKYDFQSLMESVLKADFSKIEQNFRYLEFSDLPLTIARGRRCFIDLYFWRRRPTVIHNHHFSGAFQCLQGSNVDLEFAFTPKHQLGKFHSSGEIVVQKVHSIKPGDIQAIAPLDRFIHQNHHHADLSVNLCFRTPDLKKGNISNYLYSGLRFEKHPYLVERFQRLYRAIQLEQFNFKRIDFSIDDALFFLLQTEGTTSPHQNLQNLMQHFRQKVKRELKLDVGELLRKHDQELDRLEEEYN